MPSGKSYYLGPPGPTGYCDDPSYRDRRERRDGWDGPVSSLEDISRDQWEMMGYSIIDVGYKLPREETRELVMSLRSLGASYNRINRLTGVSRRTIKRWVESE